VIGSPISMLLSDFIPTRRFLRLETFVEELSQEFKKVEDKVDIEYITTDEFAFLFEQCFKAASENYQKEKIDSFKAILVNATIDKSLIQLEKEFFLNLTKQLTVLHIQILNFLHDTRDYIKRKGLEENEIQGHYKVLIPLIFSRYRI
jgi:DNA replication initiation complex subunit (GINS family)